MNNTGRSGDFSTRGETQTETERDSVETVGPTGFLGLGLSDIKGRVTMIMLNYKLI